MAEPFIGEIRMMGFTYAPRGWADCNGQLLPIDQNSALFSLYGTIYGGDGRTTFGLPDLRGRVPIHEGTGPGLTPRQMGQRGGAETTTEVPAHVHNYSIAVNNASGDSDNPAGRYMGVDSSVGATPYANAAASGEFMAQQTTGQSGTAGGANNMQPFLTIRFCCALVGIFPPRN